MHVAVTSVIVQMSTQFMLHVATVHDGLIHVNDLKTAVVLQKMKLACAGRWRLSRMAPDSQISRPLKAEDHESPYRQQF